MSIRASVRARAGAFELAADFKLPATGMTVLVGRSGSGKTTLLRWLAGLLRAREGKLNVQDEVWEDTEKGIFIPPHRRGVGYVFQEGSLFPHLSVRENLQYAFERVPRGRTALPWDQVIALLGVEPFLDRVPHGLSGGERQRVAIARSLLSTPRLLLLDEPLASLDPASKSEIIPCLEHLKTAFQLPMIHVTHALEEVAGLADQVLELHDGRLRELRNSGRKKMKIPAVSFVGHSGSGKTTLIEALIPRLKARGYRVGAIKHDAHDFQIDHPGKDSHRFTTAGADTMVIASGSKLALVASPASPPAIEEILERHFQGMDVVLTEGYKAGSLPKIAVQRSGASVLALAEIENLMAIASDLPQESSLPRLNLNDPSEIAAFIEKRIIGQTANRILP